MLPFLCMCCTAHYCIYLVESCCMACICAEVSLRLLAYYVARKCQRCVSIYGIYRSMQHLCTNEIVYACSICMYMQMDACLCISDI